MRLQNAPIVLGGHIVPVPTLQQALSKQDRYDLNTAVAFVNERIRISIDLKAIERYFIRLNHRMQCLKIMIYADRHSHFKYMSRREEYKCAFNKELTIYPGIATKVLDTAHRLSQIKEGYLTPQNPDPDCEYFSNLCTKLADIATSRTALEEWDFKKDFYTNLIRTDHRFFIQGITRERTRKIGTFEDEVQTVESARKDIHLPIFCEAILSDIHETKTLIDYGCGTGDLIEGMVRVSRQYRHKLKLLHYKGFDVSEIYVGYMRTEVHNNLSDVFESFEAFTLQTPDAKSCIKALEGSGSICAIRNVFHEVSLTEQCLLWKDVIRLACPDGFIHIFEIMDLPKEEKDYVLWDERDITLFSEKLSINVSYNYREPFRDSFPVLRAKLLPTEQHMNITTDQLLEILCHVYDEKLRRFGTELSQIKNRHAVSVDHPEDQCRRVSLETSISYMVAQLTEIKKSDSGYKSCSILDWPLR